MNQYSRTTLLIGPKAIETLHNARVLIFGVGGVGGYAIEALARSGVGHMDLVDDDMVCLTNLNRQLLALRSTIGHKKADLAKERVHDIDPKIEVNVFHTFLLPDNADEFDFSKYDYVVDAVDTVTAKIEIIMRAKAAGVPIVWISIRRRWTRWRRSCAMRCGRGASATSCVCGRRRSRSARTRRMTMTTAGRTASARRDRREAAACGGTSRALLLLCRRLRVLRLRVRLSGS